jgi:hypothetical protein
VTSIKVQPRQRGIVTVDQGTSSVRSLARSHLPVFCCMVSRRLREREGGGAETMDRHDRRDSPSTLALMIFGPRNRFCNKSNKTVMGRQSSAARPSRGTGRFGIRGDFGAPGSLPQSCAYRKVAAQVALISLSSCGAALLRLAAAAQLSRVLGCGAALSSLRDHYLIRDH